MYALNRQVSYNFTLNVNDLDFDLPKSLNAKCDSTAGLLVYDLPLVLNSDICSN